MNSGVTLIELTIYMGLFMGLLLMLSGLFVSILDIQQESVETARIEQDSQYLFARLQHDIMQAEEVLQPSENGESSEMLVLSTAEGELIYMLDDSRITISTDSANLKILNSPGVITSDLSFQRLGNEDGYPSIRTSLVLESAVANQSQPEKRELVYTFGTR